MLIQYHRQFEKHFAKLQPAIKQKVIAAIQRFAKNSFDPKLKNHMLTGRLFGQRAISVMGDMRVIFEERDNYVLVIMLDIGTHNQVYK
jgi:addiction module RelE/StbE family toxin